MDKRNIIITTHSKRLRQFVSKYFKNFKRKLRFKNCAILQIYFDEISSLTKIKLLYDGETDKEENRNEQLYYNRDIFNILDIYSNKLIVPPNINIFLIRHAQGYHNANNTLIKKFIANFDNKILKDPQLTDIGIKQSLKSGQFLNTYFDDNKLNKNLCILFCSVLLRTRETLNIILDNMDIFDKEIIILPMSNEITNFTIPEHLLIDRHMCTNNQTKRLIYKCDAIVDKNNKLRHINWEYFNEFKKNINNKKDTNMIYQMYIIVARILNKSDDYINKLENNLTVNNKN